jgi:hypothetical protein
MKRVKLAAALAATVAIATADAGPVNGQDTFAGCWAAAGTSPQASRDCIKRFGSVVRPLPEFACLQAIAFARSVWREAARDAHETCEYDFRQQRPPQSIPASLARQYQTAVDAWPPTIPHFIVPDGSGGVSGTVIVLESGGGHVRGYCRDVGACLSAGAVLDAYMRGEEIDPVQARAAIEATPDLRFECDTSALCEAFRTARGSIEGGRHEAPPRAALRAELDFLATWRCSDPDACAALDRAREGSGSAADYRRLQAAVRDGSAACVGESCPDLTDVHSRGDLIRLLQQPHAGTAERGLPPEAR